MRILFFAQIKDATSCSAMELVMPTPVDTGQLWEVLIAKFPPLAHHQTNVRLARNWEYADAQTQFTNGDEVALIPPVSGG
jgi:molybdopterin synthase catalytic subunit